MPNHQQPFDSIATLFPFATCFIDMSLVNTDDLEPPVGERHVLKAETELRLEVPHGGKTCTLQLQRGSCELWGMELALNRAYALTGGMKLALFTWHGCVVDVDCDAMEISYTSEETAANVAYVNTHAQLEAQRDAALASQGEGPRVMIVGPPESGKSSLAKILMAYATKLGRSPVWVDLDPADNALSVPGTLSVAPATASAVAIDTYATTGLPPGTATPLVLWFGSTSLENVDLYKAQVSALATKIDARLEGDINARASGLIVNTNGSIQDEGYQLLLHTLDAMRITVVLVMGHDRLYSMMSSHVQKQPHLSGTKLIKLPRSGGVVSRDAAFRRQSRSLSMKRYFNGDMVLPPNAQAGANPVPQLTPFLAHIPFADVTLYKLSSVTLSASLLPVAGTQATEAVQLTPVNVTEQLQHSLLAVCHPAAVKAYEESGSARDLYETGVAGFVSVDRVVMDTEMLHLLCPCAGALPSHTLLVGDLTWME
jgi:polyribonucleotide 5'-hydroxyl-kinase